MNRLRPAEKLIVAAHIGLGLFIAFGGTGAVVLNHQLFKALALGIFTAQAVLLGLWCGLAESAAVRRWAKTGIGAALLWSLAVTAFHGWVSGGAMMAMLVWLIVPFAALGLFANLLRRNGIRIQWLDTGSSPNMSEGVQFSLRQLMLITFGCALLLALARGLRSLGDAMTVPVFLAAGGFLAVAFGFQTLACLWAALGRGRWSRRVWLPLFMACTWPPLLTFAAGGRRGQYELFAVMALIQAGLVVLTLLALRRAGYRLVLDRFAF